MVEFDMFALCSDVDYKETLPVRSFTHLAPSTTNPPTPPSPNFQIGGYDHGSKPLSVLSTCNVGSCVRLLATFKKKCMYAGKEELKPFF